MNKTKLKICSLPKYKKAILFNTKHNVIQYVTLRVLAEYMGSKLIGVPYNEINFEALRSSDTDPQDRVIDKIHILHDTGYTIHTKFDYGRDYLIICNYTKDNN